MDLLTLGTIVGSLGGFELIKWLGTRKAARRKAHVEADRDEWALMREQLVYFQEEVKDKTRLIRELNHARIDDAQRLHELEMELYDKECKRRTCAFRFPSKPFTPCYPERDISVFEYFNVKPQPSE